MRFSAFRAFVGLSCSLAIGASAQTSPAAAESGFISGIVLDAAGNSPIRRAIVTLSTVEAQPQDAVAWSDANGRFSFGYLPAGRYQLRVTRDGYQPAAYGARNPGGPPATIQLAASESRSDLIFRLKLISSISGVVLDEDGDPLPGVRVMVMLPEFRRGKRTLATGPASMTDSNGRYTVTGLVGGQYAVSANSVNRPAVKIHPEAAAGEPQQQYSYGYQYYPGADRSESATLIGIQPGQEISSIDFRMRAQPAVTIEAKVMVPPAVSIKDVSGNIVDASESFANRMFGVSGGATPDYHFIRAQLPPGPYFLLAQGTIDGKPYRGVLKIDVQPLGLHDFIIPLEATIDLSGSVSIEGPDAGKQAAYTVSFAPGDDNPWRGQPLRVNVSKDGSFKFTNVPLGIWDIVAGPIPTGGYVKSVQLGDQDVLTEDMTIRPSTSEPLKIVFSTRAATFEGDVLQGDQPARGVVVLAPEAKLRHMAGFYRFATTDEKGHFEINRARPGEYRLFAFEDLDQQSIQDPDFLKPFERFGVPVTLREGPNDPQKISLIPAASPAGAQP